MTRAIAAAGAFLAVATLAAGCGSSSHPTAGQLRGAIRSARHADRGLAIFPLAPGTIRCRIPPGGTHLRGAPGIRGRCTTSVRSAAGGKITVMFFERGTYPTSGDIASIALGGRWVVTVSRRGAVLGYTVTGDPPQLTK